jgi:hypothetical protein
MGGYNTCTTQHTERTHKLGSKERGRTSGFFLIRGKAVLNAEAVNLLFTRITSAFPVAVSDAAMPIGRRSVWRSTCGPLFYPIDEVSIQLLQHRSAIGAEHLIWKMAVEDNLSKVVGEPIEQQITERERERERL